MSRPPQDEIDRILNSRHLVKNKKIKPDWCCPVCERSVTETIRWYHDTRVWGTMICLHHDHGKLKRFKALNICQDCNNVDGKIKFDYAHLRLTRAEWSFTPEEIKSVITPAPHRVHRIHYERAIPLAQKLMHEHY